MADEFVREQNRCPTDFRELVTSEPHGLAKWKLGTLVDGDLDE
jgi:hypothetical protein